MLRKRITIILNNIWRSVCNIFKLPKHTSFPFTNKWPPSHVCTKVRITGHAFYRRYMAYPSHFPPPDGCQIASSYVPAEVFICGYCCIDDAVSIDKVHIFGTAGCFHLLALSIDYFQVHWNIFINADNITMT
jgi:hypothetical protein